MDDDWRKQFEEKYMVSHEDNIRQYWEKREKEERYGLLDEEREQSKEERIWRIRNIIAIILLIVLVALLLYEYFFYYLDKKAAEEEKQKVLQYAREHQIDFDESDYAEYVKLLAEYYENDTSHNYIDAIKHRRKKREIGKTTYYYDDKDLQALDHDCDANHMKQTYEEFCSFWSESGFAITFQADAEMNEETNYCVKYNNGAIYTYFDTRYYANDSGLHIELNVDTSTGKLHKVTFSGRATDGFYYIPSKWLTQAVSDVFCEEYLKQQVNIAGENDIMYFRCEEGILISFYTSEDYVSIHVYPEEDKNIYEKGMETSAQFSD